MTRWQAGMIVALVLVATKAESGSETESLRLNDQPKPAPIDSALSSVLATDKVWVQRIQESTTSASRMSPDQLPRLRAILSRADRAQPGQDVPEICESCPDQLPIKISFGARSADGKPLDVYLWFRETQARYFGRAGWVFQASFRGDAPELLALVKSTLPGDAVVQRYAWHPRPDSLPPEIMLRGEENPKFGQYVYVEELPEAVVKAPPEYPLDALKQGVGGTVMIQALVDRRGNVADTRVIKSIPLLDNAAVAAVRQWKFKPATGKGGPVAVWVAIPVKFSIH